MEKISIKINHVALEQLCQTLEIPHYNGSMTSEQKVVASIMTELSKKLEKKEISKRHTQQKFKISFEYYEAFALEKHCRNVFWTFHESAYLSHVSHDIANQIHQQL